MANTSLATTRFTDATWQENCDFRKLASSTCQSLGCIYATPFLLDARVKKRTRVFVIEMNNSKNQILGIGLVRNYPIAQKYRVYSNEDYNRYVFLGKYRLDRSQITDTTLLKKLEAFCFFGKGHHKRLRGITRISPQKWLQWGQENWCMVGTDECVVHVPNIVCMIDRMFCEHFQLCHKDREDDDSGEIHW